MRNLQELRRKIPPNARKLLRSGIAAAFSICLAAAMFVPEPGASICWFTISAILAVLVVCLIEEILTLSKGWRICTILVCGMIAIALVWLANSYVARKAEGIAWSQIGHDASESKRATEQTKLSNSSDGQGEVTELAPFVVSKTVSYKIEGKDVSGVRYGLAAILRIKAKSLDHARGLTIVGDVSMDCSEYEDAFGKVGEVIGSHGQECEKRRPFYRLSWIAWPTGSFGAIQDEQFLKFMIQGLDHFGTMYLGAPLNDYIGFFNEGKAPKLLTTVPRLKTLVDFTSVSGGRLLGPRLKGEVAKGSVKFQVQLGSKNLNVQTIRRIRLIGESEWTSAPLQELFYATDPWNRAAPSVASEVADEVVRRLTDTTVKRGNIAVIFKDSPLFTAERRRRIMAEISQFRDYLTKVGFNIPSEMPPLGSRPGNALGMSWTTPGTIYDAQILIPEGRIDDPDTIRSAYSLWIFRNLLVLDFTSPFVVHSYTASSIFDCYFRSSFAGRNVCGHNWSGRAWFNSLWQYRLERGKDFVDKAMLFTAKRWEKPIRPDMKFADFFIERLMAGVWVLDNSGEDAESLYLILKANGLSLPH